MPAIAPVLSVLLPESVDAEDVAEVVDDGFDVEELELARDVEVDVAVEAVVVALDETAEKA